jgi:hypothetical protein
MIKAVTANDESVLRLRCNRGGAALLVCPPALTQTPIAAHRQIAGTPGRNMWDGCGTVFGRLLLHAHSCEHSISAGFRLQGRRRLGSVGVYSKARAESKKITTVRSVHIRSVHKGRDTLPEISSPGEGLCRHRARLSASAHPEEFLAGRKRDA